MPAPETPEKLPADDSGPDAIRRNFAAVAAATDTPAPGHGMRLITVNSSMPIMTLARTIAGILNTAPIFLSGESIVTVDEATGNTEAMDPLRFVSWVERYLVFTRPIKESPVVESIGKDKAALILRSDDFRQGLRSLKGVAPVRTPVWKDEDGSRKVELAPVGFDAESGLFTVDSIPYQDDMSADDAWTFLWEALREFPYDAEGQAEVKYRRSFSAQFAAMIGVYCHTLFPDGTNRPLIVYNANQPGSGKSLLMRLALCPVHGEVGESDKADDEKSFQTVLETAALQRDPYLILDNCYHLRSKSLDRFLTSPIHKPRLFNKQESRAVRNCTQIFCTGNSLSLTADLDRRALVIDLFVPGEATSRKFKHEITEEWFPRPEIRAKFLGALWAIVRKWRDDGMPRMKEHRRASFETWSGIIGGIVCSAGMTNPFTPRTAENGGDESTRALKIVLGQLAGEAFLETPPVLKTSDILSRAETADLIELIVPPDKNPAKALGWAIKALGLPRHLVDSQGRAFELRKRDLAKGAGYVIRFL